MSRTNLVIPRVLSRYGSNHNREAMLRLYRYEVSLTAREAVFRAVFYPLTITIFSL